MRSTIVENRGILNLIPNKIIDQNKAEVEELIKKLKDWMHLIIYLLT